MQTSSNMMWLCFCGVIFLWQYGSGAQFNFKYPSPITSIVYQMEPGRAGLNLTWKPVQSWDEKNPVIGYKVIVWEMKTGKKIVHRFVNGELIDEEVEDNTFPAKVPVGQPKIFTLPFDKREVSYGYIKPDIWYELAGLAITKNGEGPLSPITGIKTEPQKIHAVDIKR